MDIEKLIERLEAWNEQHLSVVCGNGHFACAYLCENEDCIVVRAATALSTLQAENKRLNKIVCSIPTTPDSGRTVSQYDKEMSMCAYLDDLEPENEKLRAELEYEKEHANAYYEECGQWEAENTQLKEKLEALKQDRDAIEQDFRAFAKQWWEQDSGFPCRWCKFENSGGCEWKAKQPNEEKICAGRAFEWRGQQKEG